MINLIGVSFRNFEYVSKSLNSIIDNASESLCITVVDNYDIWPDSGCERIREYLKGLVAAGKIKRTLLFDDNNIGWSLTVALQEFPPDDSEDFFMLTDLDVSIPAGHDWIKEVRQARAEGAVLSGYSLSTDNYILPNEGYSPIGFGLHCVAADTRIYREYHGYNQNTLDSRMIDIFAQHGKVMQLHTGLYHHTWDIFLPKEKGGDPTYAEYKRQLGTDWTSRRRPDNMPYTLIEGIDPPTPTVKPTLMETILSRFTWRNH